MPTQKEKEGGTENSGQVSSHKTMSKRITVYLLPEVFEMLTRLAQEQRRSMNNMISTLIIKATHESIGVRKWENRR